MIAHIDTEVIRELALARDRLLRCEGAVDQAGKAVEAARAAHRRAVEERDGERALVERLERELKEGADRRPLLAAIAERSAANGAADPPLHPKGETPAAPPRRRAKPADAGGADTSREAAGLSGGPMREATITGAVPTAAADRLRAANRAARGIDDGEDDGPTTPYDYDREIAAAVEEAEARRNGHPADRHIARVDRLAESGALGLPPEDDGPAADWRAVTVEELMREYGVAGDDIAGILRGAQDCPTVGDVADTLEVWGFDAFDMSGRQIEDLKGALIGFREEQGWDGATKWPGGIPAAWLEDGQGGAEPADDGPWWKHHEGCTPLDLATMGDVDRALAICLTTNIGAEERWASLRAAGAADDAIAEEIRRRGDGGIYPGTYRNDGHPGYMLRIVRGKPRFWCGSDYEFEGPGRKRRDLPPTLEGNALVDAARRVLVIPLPTDPGKSKDRDSGISAPPAGPIMRSDGDPLVSWGGGACYTPRHAPAGGAWDVPTLRAAIAACEGKPGDGYDTVLCSGCRAARPKSEAGGRCPKCQGYGTRLAVGIMVDLGAVPPATPESLTAPDPDPPTPAGPGGGKPARKPEQRRPGETVRAARARRRSERNAGVRRAINTPESAALACEIHEGAREQLAGRKASPPADVAEGRPDGAAIGPPAVPPPPGDAWEAPDGWREATEEEWLAAGPYERHDSVRAVRTAPAPSALASPEWRSADLEERLRAAVGWGGAAERLTHCERPPTALEILAELGDCWSNAAHIHKMATGYRVRGGRTPAFWMGEDTSRRPTLEGAALADRVRRVLRIGFPPLSPGPDPADGKRASGAERRRRSRARREEAADVAG